jgi:hypothetical protein
MAEQENNVQQTIAKQVEKLKGDDISIKYRGLTYEMAAELAQLEEEFFFWDEPVPFGEKLKLYPVNIKDYNTFMDAVSCFLLDRKQLPPNSKPEDIKKQLKMTDLDFLISKMEEPIWRLRLVNLVKLVFHVENGMKCSKCGKIISYEEIQSQLSNFLQEFAEAQKRAQQGEEIKFDEKKIPTIICPECGGDELFETIKYEENEQTHKNELYIDGQLIDFKNFNRLKNIVLFQNLPDYRDTSYIDPALKKDYETQKRIKGQKQANLTATLEKKLVALNIFKGLSGYEWAKNLTIRKFLLEFSTMDDLLSYMIGMMGRVCGLGGGPKEIEHWIYQEIKDVYADGGYISKDTMMEKTKAVR